MTYVPPDRPEGNSAEPEIDQTRQLDFTPAAPEAGRPVDPFAGQPATTVGYAEQPRPAKDRVVFQFVWEAILLLLTANALFLVYQRQDRIFGESASLDVVDPQLTGLSALLLLATGFGLSLRFGAVNFALPAFTYLVIAVPTLFVGANPLVGLGFMAAAAALLTVLFVILTAVLRVPAWLAGLASAFAVAAMQAPLGYLAREIGFTEEAGTWSNPGGLWLFLGAVAVSVAGGLLGLLPGVRDRMTAVKAAVEGTGARTGASVFSLIGATFLSLLLAGAAGFVPAVFASAGAGSEWAVGGLFAFSTIATLSVSPFVFIVVLLAGTSPWGRRGGVFGTSLAAVALWALLQVWTSLSGPASDPQFFVNWTGVLYAGLLLLGLFVAFGLDRLGRPKEPVEPETAAHTGEMVPFEPTGGDDYVGTGLFEPTLPDATAAPR